jgi:hypothetical protein
MRWVIGVLLTLIVLSAGCLGPGSEKGGSVTNSLSPLTSSIHTSSSPSTATSTTSKPEEIELGKILEGITSYSYSRDIETKANVTILFEDNTTHRTGFSTRIHEVGYVDLKARKAKINITSTTFPDNETLNIGEIVINDTAYMIVGSLSRKVNSTDFWETHPLAILYGLSGTKPLAEYTENGTLVLVYSPPREPLLPLAEGYFGAGGANVTVTDAVLEVYVGDGTIRGMGLVYSVRVSTSSEGLLGKMKIFEVGTWKSAVKITSINEKEEVKPPTT